MSTFSGTQAEHKTRARCIVWTTNNIVKLTVNNMSWSFRCDRIHWNVLGQTVASRCEGLPTFRVLTPSPYSHLKMGTQLLPETSGNLHILTRLSAREHFNVTVIKLTWQDGAAVAIWPCSGRSWFTSGMSSYSGGDDGADDDDSNTNNKLAVEVQRMRNVKAKWIPAAIVVTGTVSKSFKIYQSNMPRKYCFKELQKQPHWALHTQFRERWC